MQCSMLISLKHFLNNRDAGLWIFCFTNFINLFFWDFTRKQSHLNKDNQEIRQKLVVFKEIHLERSRNIFLIH